MKAKTKKKKMYKGRVFFLLFCILPPLLHFMIFYIFPNISKFGMSSEEFCEKLIREQRLAIVPGSAFGESGEGHVRISYAYSKEHLKEALKRLKVFVEEHTK